MESSPPPPPHPISSSSSSPSASSPVSEESPGAALASPSGADLASPPAGETCHLEGAVASESHDVDAGDAEDAHRRVGDAEEAHRGAANDDVPDDEGDQVRPESLPENESYLSLIPRWPSHFWIGFSPFFPSHSFFFSLTFFFSSSSS